MAFGVIQAGQENVEFPTYEKDGTGYKNTGEKHKGVVEPIVKFDSKDQADANAAERNKRAEEAGLKALYEVKEF